MSVVLIGDLPQGKLLVTDAMVSPNGEVKSYRDCKLRDKICKSVTSHGYYSLVGDGTILYGMDMLDSWASKNGNHLDFTEYSAMKGTLDITEKIIIAIGKTGRNQNEHLNDNLSYVYTISPRMAALYYIERQKNRYHITRPSKVFNNEVSVNYAGFIESVDIHIFQNADPKDCIEIAANYIKKHHEIRVTSNKKSLNYEFDNRFCGVLIPREGDDIVMLPFRSFDEFIITLAGGEWNLIESPPFQ